MQIFLVGGCVRDELLGLPITDRDWVVVDSSPEEMLALGFKQVGKDFPVFLHPTTNEEYALARIERKTGPGYYGFECIFSKKVTLTEDLQRRDLTINAIAKSRDGIIIDPFAGQVDLNQRILRHVSMAFVEDPVRVLRVARFLARFFYLGFSVALATMELMRQMVASGELNNLVKERVWAEMVKALATRSPEQFFILLNELQVFVITAPELVAIDLLPLKLAAQQAPGVLIRFGALAQGFSNEQQFLSFAHAMHIPNEFKKFGLLCVRYKIVPTSAPEIYALFKELRLYSSGGLALLEDYLQACAEGSQHKARLQAAYTQSLQVNASSIQAQGFVGAAITTELDLARIKLINDSTYTKN